MTPQMLWDWDVSIDMKRKWVGEHGKEALENMHQQWFAQHVRKRPLAIDDSYPGAPIMMNYMFPGSHGNPMMMMHPFPVCEICMM